MDRGPPRRQEASAAGAAPPCCKHVLVGVDPWQRMVSERHLGTPHRPVQSSRLVPLWPPGSRGLAGGECNRALTTASILALHERHLGTPHRPVQSSRPVPLWTPGSRGLAGGECNRALATASIVALQTRSLTATPRPTPTVPYGIYAARDAAADPSQRWQDGRPRPCSPLAPNGPPSLPSSPHDEQT